MPAPLIQTKPENRGGTASRIRPQWSMVDELPTPLTEGEGTLARYLDETLPPAWEIYLQPFLNGDRPDLVVLRPEVGLMIFEVKDWRSDCYRSQPVRGDRPQGRRTYLVNDGRDEHVIKSPKRQVERYRRNLLSLYEPAIGEEIDRNSKAFAAFRVGLYFHKMTTTEANKLTGTPRYTTVAGRDALTEGNLRNVVPDAHRTRSRAMKSDWAEKIRFWLDPPYHAAERGEPIQLTDEQKRHVEPDADKHQRLRGVAGSGKTLVLAHRAANIAAQGKKVLVVSYNITLWHYIRDHVRRVQAGFDWANIEFIHFHGFCRNFLSENDIDWPTGEGDQVLHRVVPNMVLEAKEAGKNAKERSYDAILIDEGQDFQLLWYESLCAFLSDESELLLVADERQNVYDRDKTWVDQGTTGAQFRGPWRTLIKSYRLPHPLAQEANRFSSLFLPEGDEHPMATAQKPDLFDPKLRWKNTDTFSEARRDAFAIFRRLTEDEGRHPSDVVILTLMHHLGLNLVKEISRRGVKANHVFDEHGDHGRRNKKSFWMGDGRLKICTLHSFKGWEVPNVILITPGERPRISQRRTDRLVYTALTRARENLFVLNRNDRYRSFGKTWGRPTDLQ